MTVKISPLAGKAVPPELVVDLDSLKKGYYEIPPNEKNGEVSFGTSGHRGRSTEGTFQEAHVEAITQAICDVRKKKGISGPLFIGGDTHFLSGLAQKTAEEVLAGNEISVRRDKPGQFTPTPSISNAILKFNRENKSAKADGIIITPSHNPPTDGGFKYNPPHGGPAESEFTAEIQRRANEILKDENRQVKKSSSLSNSEVFDFLESYISGLREVIDMDVIRTSGITIGVHPLGGASVAYWAPIADRFGVNISVVDSVIDPTFKFMRVDDDGQIRMDCSSKSAMAELLEYKDRYDISFGNDPDADRHGIVSRKGGLLNPNHYLAVAIDYLLQNRSNWSQSAMIGKTIVSSSLIKDVSSGHGRKVYEVPVGFKWFASGLHEGSICFAGEESAGASFVCRDGKTPWSTDKDGIILGLLAAEIFANTGRDPYEHLLSLGEKYGIPAYKRIDLPTKLETANALKKITVDKIKIDTLAGVKIKNIFVNAPGNNEAIGGVFIESEDGWVALRPSGTEAKLKIYGESKKGEDALDRQLQDAEKILAEITA